jgi:hypothetical protein
MRLKKEHALMFEHARSGPLVIASGGIEQIIVEPGGVEASGWRPRAAACGSFANPTLLRSCRA